MFAVAGSLRRVRNFLRISTRIALRQCVLYRDVVNNRECGNPILYYADPSYPDLTAKSLYKIHKWITQVKVFIPK